MLVPSPAKLWKDSGLTVCSVCRRPKRCVAMSHESVMADVCEGCMSALVSPYVMAEVEGYFRSGQQPVDPRERHLFVRSNVAQAHEQVMRAIGYRYFWKAKEVRSRGWPSLENAVNHHAHPVLWILDEEMPRWLWMLLVKVPGDRIRKGL